MHFNPRTRYFEPQLSPFVVEYLHAMLSSKEKRFCACKNDRDGDVTHMLANSK
jgi:hypothetical protein